jgi:hypothetical protein
MDARMHLKRALKSLSLFSWLLLGAGCEGSTKVVISTAAPPPVSAAFLRAAPDTLSLVGYGSVIATDVYRDFTPNAPSGNPLTAVVTFSLISASDFSKNVSAVYVWVLNGDQVWKSVMTMQDPNSLPHDEVVWIARDGPPWGAGTSADVVLGLEIEGRGLQLVNLGNVTVTQVQ